jgi:outer membrane protein OmpA-like peptidoglycan-associated protein
MSQIKKKLSLLAVLLLLMPAAVLSAQQPDSHFKDARTGTIGLRMNGGAMWAFGSPFENVNANEMNLIQPFGEAGLFVNIKPWVRVGADYSYTRMIREQLFTTLEPIIGDGIITSSVGGPVYSDFKSRFHGASLTGEFDLVELLSRGNSSGKVALWLGTGLGYMFANGNTWTMNVANIMRTDNTHTMKFGFNNDPHKYNALFVPARLSLEYAFLPQVALSVGGEYRFLPVKGELNPRHMAIAKVGLVFNLTTAKNPASRRHPSPIVEPIRETVYVEQPVEKIVEKIVEVPAQTRGVEITDAMLPYVTFVRGSAVLDEDVNAPALAAMLSVLKADPTAKFDILGWTDHKGTDKINDPLSNNRAKALREYLVAHGIDASRIGVVEGHGNYPIAGEARFSVIARRAEVKLKK